MHAGWATTGIEYMPGREGGVEGGELISAGSCVVVAVPGGEKEGSDAHDQEKCLQHFPMLSPPFSQLCYHLFPPAAAVTGFHRSHAAIYCMVAPLNTNLSRPKIIRCVYRNHAGTLCAVGSRERSHPAR